MTSQKLFILVIVAVLALVAGVWLAGRQSGSSAGDTEEASLYPELKQQLNSVTAVRIFKAGDARTVEMQRKDKGWTVSERSDYPADETKLRKLLVALADAKLYEEKTSNPEQYKTLGVEDTTGADASGVRIELAGTAKPVNLIVGNQAVGARSHYVRRAGEPQSWLINSNIDTSSTPDAWLRKDLIEVSADRVQSVTVSVKGAKPYTAAKSARADANFAVEGLPKGKSLSSPSVANGFATALTGLSLADVQPASAFASTSPAAHSTFKTFDGLVVELDGWTKDDKHYIAVKTAFDPAQAERFKVATPPPADAKPADQKQGAEGAPPAADKPEPAKPAAPNVEEEAKSAGTKLAGWVYEIPEYKYESLFKPVDQLL
jgi:Domain of unknown function (DUF4340)